MRAKHHWIELKIVLLGGFYGTLLILLAGVAALLLIVGHWGLALIPGIMALGLWGWLGRDE